MQPPDFEFEASHNKAMDCSNGTKIYGNLKWNVYHIGSDEVVVPADGEEIREKGRTFTLRIQGTHVDCSCDRYDCCNGSRKTAGFSNGRIPTLSVLVDPESCSVCLKEGGTLDLNLSLPFLVSSKILPNWRGDRNSTLLEIRVKSDIRIE